MLTTSDERKGARQEGWTLIEMLLVLAIIGMLMSLVTSSSLMSTRNALTTERTRQDFSRWYQHVSQNSLYVSQPRRVCLIDGKMVVQAYKAHDGWYDTTIFYFPRGGVVMSVNGNTCGAPLNGDRDNFVNSLEFR